MLKLNKLTILLERMKRQRLLDPIASVDDEDEYIELFKRLQPVAPVHFTFPGSPPQLVHRTQFNDENLSFQLRQKHRIVKGRFAGGRVGYVLQEDLERYAIVFRKSLSVFKPIHEDIMSVIKNSGGISKDQLKEELGYPSGEISKALVTLQEAFLVYEDQTETDWDTGWFDFATEWFELQHDPDQYIQHASHVLLDYLHAIVFATFVQIKDWSQMNTKSLKQVLEKLVHDGEIHVVAIDGWGEGYIRSGDAQGFEEDGKIDQVFMLDKSDFLVRSHMSELKKHYSGQEVLQYLLIDGEFKGAVLGHWRIGPHDIDDIRVDMSSHEAEVRKAEIIHAVRKYYTPDRTEIHNYNGMKI